MTDMRRVNITMQQICHIIKFLLPCSHSPFPYHVSCPHVLMSPCFHVPMFSCSHVSHVPPHIPELCSLLAMREGAAGESCVRPSLR